MAYRSPLWRDNDVRQFCAPRKLGKGAGREWLVVVSLFVLFVLHRLAASPLALQEAQALPDGLMHCTWVKESIIESNPPSCRWLYGRVKKLPQLATLHNVQFVNYDVTVSFMTQVLDTVTYLVPQVLDSVIIKLPWRFYRLSI